MSDPVSIERNALPEESARALAALNLNNDGHPDYVVEGEYSSVIADGNNFDPTSYILISDAAGDLSLGGSTPISFGKGMPVITETAAIDADGHNFVRIESPLGVPTDEFEYINPQGQFSEIASATLVPPATALPQIDDNDPHAFGPDTVKLDDATATLTITPPEGSNLAPLAVPLFSDVPFPIPLDLVAADETGAHFSVAVASFVSPGFIVSGDLASADTSSPSPTAPCYGRGTRILTARGEVPVEDLLVGDLAVTTLGRGAALKPVRWLGHRRLALAGHPHPDDAKPIRIRAGALADGKPHRDLLVSPGHRLHLDGGLIRAIDLVNAATIVQESPDSVEYWHVELDQHDILLAEGVEAESYQDTGNRNGFENGHVTVLHPVLDAQALQPCLPYATPSTALRARLLQRADELGWTRSGDPQPWLEVDGRRIDPIRRGERYRFALPAGCNEARLRSRAGRPRDTEPAAADTRRLGLSLVRLSVCGPAGSREVRLDDDLLRDGFSHIEQDESGWAWRWTDGDARLPLASLARGREITALEIALDPQQLLFWQAPAAIAVREPEGRSRIA